MENVPLGSRKFMEHQQKLYAYVDESGQDTKGIFFVVSILILGDEREKILRLLERFEKESGKKIMKWRKTRPEYRSRFLELIQTCPDVRRKIFFREDQENQGCQKR